MGLNTHLISNHVVETTPRVSKGCVLIPHNTLITLYMYYALLDRPLRHVFKLEYARKKRIMRNKVLSGLFSITSSYANSIANVRIKG